MENVFDSKLEDQLKNLEFAKGDFVIYDPTKQFDDESELHFKVGVIRPDSEKGLVLDGMIYRLEPTGKKRITHIYIPQYPKVGVPINQFKSIGKYIGS